MNLDEEKHGKISPWVSNVTPKLTLTGNLNSTFPNKYSFLTIKLLGSPFAATVPKSVAKKIVTGLSGIRSSAVVIWVAIGAILSGRVSSSQILKWLL